MITREVKQLLGRLRGDLARALLRTFVARGVAAIGGFALVVVMGRLYGAQGVGVYALGVSFVMGVGVFARWGMDNALVRFVGRDTRSPKVRPFLWLACKRAVIISMIAAALVYLFHAQLAKVFHSPQLVLVVWGMAVAIPAYVLACVLSGFLAAVHKPATACLLQNGVISFATALLVVILHMLLPALGLWVIGWAYAVAAWAALAWGILEVRRWLHVRRIADGHLNKLDVSEFRRSSSAFFAIDVASFLMGIAGIWVAGYLLPTSDVGLYKAALQLAGMIGMIIMVINLIVPTRFSNLHHTGDILGLNRLARRGAAIGTTLAIIPFLACLFVPRRILDIVGPDFSGAALVLQILAVGQLFNVACGSIGHVLNMSGHERLSGNIVWATNIVGFMILVFGTYRFGVVGTAVGVASAQVLRKLAGVYYGWRYVGVWVIPIPNVLQLIGIRGAECAGKKPGKEG